MRVRWSNKIGFNCMEAKVESISKGKRVSNLRCYFFNGKLTLKKREKTSHNWITLPFKPPQILPFPLSSIDPKERETLNLVS